MWYLSSVGQLVSWTLMKHLIYPRKRISVLRWTFVSKSKAFTHYLLGPATLALQYLYTFFIVMTTPQAECSHPWKLDENMWWYFETKDQTTYIYKDATFDARIKWVECISIKKHLEYHLTPCQSYLIHNTSRWCCLWNSPQKVSDITRNVFSVYRCALIYTVYEALSCGNGQWLSLQIYQ